MLTNINDIRDEIAEKGKDDPTYSFLSSIEYKSSLKSIDLPDVKRFPLVDLLISADSITDQNHFEQRMCDHVHGILSHRQYLPNFDVSDDFNDEYERNGALQILQNVPKQTISPKPSRKKESTTDTTTSATTAPSPPPKKSSSSSQPSTCKITMSIADIVKHFGVVYFQRGRDYFRDHRIDKFKTKSINSVAFKLYTTCQGSLEDPYKEESLFKDGRILKAICTCPVGGDGICKHVCAQLLAYMDKNSYIASKNGQPQPQQPEQVIPFDKLDPISENWCIRCKVIKKSAVRNWSNERGSGVVASILVRDESVNPGAVNHIRLVLFNEALDEYFDMLQPNHIFTISKAHLYVPNPNHREDKNMRVPFGSESEYEIHLKEKVTHIVDVSNGPKREEDIKEVFESRLNKSDTSGAIEFVPFGGTLDDEEPPAPRIIEEPVSRVIEESPKRKREDDDDEDVEDLFFPGMRRSPKKKLRASLDTTTIDDVINVDQSFDQIMQENVNHSPLTIIDDDDDDEVIMMDNIPEKKQQTKPVQNTTVIEILKETPLPPPKEVTEQKSDTSTQKKRISLKALIENSNKS
jgi:hypothetical protein